MKKLTLVAALGLIGAFGGVGDVWGNSRDCPVKKIKAETEVEKYYDQESNSCQEICKVEVNYEVKAGDCPEGEEKAEEKLCEETRVFRIARKEGVPPNVKDKVKYCDQSFTVCAADFRHIGRLYPRIRKINAYPDLSDLFKQIAKNPTVWQCLTPDPSPASDETTSKMFYRAED
jgi:hypothetical protein